MSTLDCDGATLWFEVVGEGELLVVLHGGLGLDHTYLRPWLDPLAERRSLVFLDQRANGRSTGAGESLTLQRLADDVDALRKHLGHERVSLLGHSYGGFVALQYALTHLERLAALVLCDTGATSPAGESVMREAARLGAAQDAIEAFGADVRTDADLQRWWAAVAQLYLPHAEPVVAASAVADVVYSREGRTAGDRALAGWDVTERLPDIRAANLVAVGRDDFLFPPGGARALADRIAGAELRVFDRSGHLPFVEQRDAFLREVGRFLDQHALGQS